MENFSNRRMEILMKNMTVETEKRYVVGRKSIPYFINALLSKFNKLTMDSDFDQSELEFKKPSNLDEFFNVYGMEKNGNAFNTKKIRAKTKEIVDYHLETGKPLQLVTIVCPPYAKKRLGARENKGLITNFEDDPIDHGFLYSYKLLAHTFCETALFFKSLGLTVKPIFIIGDWALRDKFDRENSYFNNGDLADAQLENFYQSATKYFKKTYPEMNVHVDRFFNSIAGYLPFVMPQTPEDKAKYCSAVFGKNRLHIYQFPYKKTTVISWALPAIYKYYFENKFRFYELINKDKWSSFMPPNPARPFNLDDISEVQAFYDKYGYLDFTLDDENNLGKEEYKQVWIRFLQIFSDTLKSRRDEDEKGLAETNMDILDAGFMDAMMKFYEYVIYGLVFKEKYQESLMAYFDTKYPSAGLGFEEGGFDLLYLDTHNYWTPMSKLGIRLNPF